VNALDLAIALTAVSAAVGGWRLGFTARAASWIGMAGGLVVGAQIVLPWLLEVWADVTGVRLLLAAAAVLVIGAFLGQAAGLVVGNRLHLALPAGAAKMVDKVGGAAAGVLGVAAAVWLLLPAMADIPEWPAEQARNSALGQIVDGVLPPAPDALQTLRQLVNDDRFPQVFDALRPTPDLGPPPAESGLGVDVADAVRASTVKVEGVACSRIQDGSGFVVGDGLVATNAHVVAGESETTVEREDGTMVDAVVVAFDPDRDLAVLFAPGLERPPLAIGEAEVGDRGAVFGHPGGGPLVLTPFEVGRQVTATGRDIYGQRRTTRDVLFLAARLRPGDSGAALVDPAGEVVGVAFAIAPDQPGVAYALTTTELRHVLASDLTAPVNTGACLA
jgi:S1-C subfamily serine protease